MIFERAVTEKMYDFYKSTHLSHLGVALGKSGMQIFDSVFCANSAKKGEYLYI